MNKHLRFFYALYLTWYALAWIWTRVFMPLNPWLSCEMTFQICFHCDERFSRPGLIYCQKCIDEMGREYQKEMEEVTE